VDGERLSKRWGGLAPLQRRLVAPPSVWYADLAVGGGLLGLLYLVVAVAHSYPPAGAGAGPRIDLGYGHLPIYAALSVFRMAAAYVLSLAFSLAYGYLAAYNRRAEKVLLPVLDILQSIPVLSFLPSVVLALVALFPHGRFGVEMASILLIFTAQAWNMTFSFYHSLITIPRELREVAAMHQLSAWQRFRRLELPFAVVGLVWNSMMSWAGGWFFLMASEMFSLGSRDFRLPGLGSYLQVAANRGDYAAIAAGLATLFLVIVAIDQLLWRPVVAWADKFKIETVRGEAPPRSAVLIVLRRSRLVDWLHGRLLSPLGEALDRRFSGQPARPPAGRTGRSGQVLAALLALGVAYAVWRGVALLSTLPARQAALLPEAALATFLRVWVSLIAGAAWTVPVGVFIGMHRAWANRLQPVVQILASFPATALFPVLVLWIVRAGGGLNLASVALMLLGTQWYVLFNVIAGAMAIPDDLKEAAHLFGLRGWERWRTLVLPAIFPHLVTGLVTAAGGAWNASIVSEYVRVSGQTLATTGLGALISTATDRGDYALLLASTASLSVLVVLVNRLFWRRLYGLAEQRFSLG
jgi:NitT/TauT family transport system permease protein